MYFQQGRCARYIQRRQSAEDDRPGVRVGGDRAGVGGQQRAGGSAGTAPCPRAK